MGLSKFGDQVPAARALGLALEAAYPRSRLRAGPRLRSRLRAGLRLWGGVRPYPFTLEPVGAQVITPAYGHVLGVIARDHDF